MPYDPTLEALVAAMLQSLDHDADMTQGYLDQLRQLTVTLTHILADPEGHVPTPEQEAMMRHALSVLHPSAGDGALGYGEVVQRLQVAIERELSRWASSMIQPRSFSGQTVLPVGGGEWEPHTAGTPVLSPLARL